MKTVRRRGTWRETVSRKAAGGRLQICGFSLVEVLISLSLLSLFLLGGMVLYVSSLKQQAKAREILTAAWLAKGKLEQMGVTAAEGAEVWRERSGDWRVRSDNPEEQGNFAPPHEGYTYQVREDPLVGESSYRILSLTVIGPTGGRVTLRTLVSP